MAPDPVEVVGQVVERVEGVLRRGGSVVRTLAIVCAFSATVTWLVVRARFNDRSWWSALVALVLLLVLLVPAAVTWFAAWRVRQTSKAASGLRTELIGGIERGELGQLVATLKDASGGTETRALRTLVAVGTAFRKHRDEFTNIGQAAASMTSIPLAIGIGLGSLPVLAMICLGAIAAG